MNLKDLVEQINFIEYLVRIEGYSIIETESKLFTNSTIFKYAELVNLQGRKLLVFSPTQIKANHYLYKDRLNDEKGDIVQYLKYKGMDYKTIFVELCKFQGISKSDFAPNFAKIETKDFEFQQKFKNPLQGENAYLKMRGITSKTLNKFSNLFEYNSNPIFPYLSIDGIVVGAELKTFKTLQYPEGTHCFADSNKIESFMFSSNYRNGNSNYSLIGENLIDVFSYLELNPKLLDYNISCYGTGGESNDSKVKLICNHIHQSNSEQNTLLLFDNDVVGEKYTKKFNEFFSELENSNSPKRICPKSKDFNRDLMSSRKLSEANLIHVDSVLFEQRKLYLTRLLEKNPGNSFITKLIEQLPELYSKLSRRKQKLEQNNNDQTF